MHNCVKHPAEWLDVFYGKIRFLCFIYTMKFMSDS